MDSSLLGQFADPEAYLKKRLAEEKEKAKQKILKKVSGNISDAVNNPVVANTIAISLGVSVDEVVRAARWAASMNVVGTPAQVFDSYRRFVASRAQRGKGIELSAAAQKAALIKKRELEFQKRGWTSYKEYADLIARGMPRTITTKAEYLNYVAGMQQRQREQAAGRKVGEKIRKEADTRREKIFREQLLKEAGIPITEEPGGVTPHDIEKIDTGDPLITEKPAWQKVLPFAAVGVGALALLLGS